MINKKDYKLIEQMFCPEEGILAKFTKVNENTIYQWLEEKEAWHEITGGK